MSDRPPSASSFYRASSPSPSLTSRPASASSRLRSAAMNVNRFVNNRAASTRQRSPFVPSQQPLNSPPASSDGRSNIFDASTAPSFTDDTVSSSNSNNWRLPLPLVGAARRKSTEWDGKRSGSAEPERKQSVFDDHQDGYDDGDDEEEEEEEEEEMPGGYDISSEYGGDEQGGGHDGYNQDTPGRQVFSDAEEKYEDEDGQEGVQVPQRGIWEDTQTTWTEPSTVGNDAFLESEAVQEAPMNARMPLQAPLPRNIGGDQLRPSNIYAGNGLPEAPAARNLAPPQQRNPPVEPARRSFTATATAAAPLRVGLQRPPPADPDQTIRLPITPNTPQPLLPDSELSKISDISALLTLLSARHTASRSAPPKDMHTELSNHLKYAYPEGDTERLKSFFQSLPETAYQLAGEIILSQKTELEGMMREAGLKRRKVMHEEVEGVKAVAEARKEKLDMTMDKRRQLRGNVQRYLVENGFRG